MGSSGGSVRIERNLATGGVVQTSCKERVTEENDEFSQMISLRRWMQRRNLLCRVSRQFLEKRL